MAYFSVPWTDLSFSGDWSAISGWQNGYRRDGEIVQVRAYVTCSSRTDGEIAVLPSGFRPPEKIRELTKFTGGVIGWVDFDTDGTITAEPHMNWDSVMVNTSFSIYDD